RVKSESQDTCPQTHQRGRPLRHSLRTLRPREPFTNLDFFELIEKRWCLSLKFAENTPEGVGLNTPKASALIRRRRWLISAQGWSAATTLGKPLNILINPVRVIPHMPNAFSVNPLFLFA